MEDHCHQASRGQPAKGANQIVRERQWQTPRGSNHEQPQEMIQMTTTFRELNLVTTVQRRQAKLSHHVDHPHNMAAN